MWTFIDQASLKQRHFEMKVLMLTSLFLSNDVTNKILCNVSTYIVEVVMLPKVDHSSISVRGLIITLNFNVIRMN